jgi:hypothetical protein
MGRPKKDGVSGAYVDKPELRIVASTVSCCQENPLGNQGSGAAPKGHQVLIVEQDEPDVRVGCSLDPRSRISWRWPCWTGAVWRRGTPKPEEDQSFSRYPLHRLEDSSLNRPCFHITYTARSRQPFQVRLDHRITRSSRPPLSA